MALARRPNGLRKNTGGCRIPTEPFSPNGLKRGWHHIPKNPLSLRDGIQMTSHPTDPFSPNGLKCGWHNIPLNPLSPKGLKRKWQAV